MDRNEFKRRFLADPRRPGDELLHARRQCAEADAVAREAEAFEDKLEPALRTAAPDDLLDRVLALPDQDHQTSRRQGLPRWLPMAMAATLLMTLGVGSIAWWQAKQIATLKTYVTTHYRHDGEMVLAAAALGEPAPMSVQQVLGELQASAGADLENLIRYIKFCPTPDGQGAHMVVMTDSGPATVIFMPDMQVLRPQRLEFGNMHAEVFRLDQGAAAVIGQRGQSLEDTVRLVREALHTGQARLPV